MTPGHRVARVQAKDRRVARKRFPWAQTIVRVGAVFVCYESAEDAGEEHGAVSNVWAESMGPQGTFHQTEFPKSKERAS